MDVLSCMLVNLRIFFVSSSTNDVGADGVAGPAADDQEVEFPLVELARLDEMINRPRWVVPVLHNGELEVLLDASIALCKKGWFYYCIILQVIALPRLLARWTTLPFNFSFGVDYVQRWGCPSVAAQCATTT